MRTLIHPLHGGIYCPPHGLRSQCADLLNSYRRVENILNILKKVLDFLLEMVYDVIVL